MLRRSPNNSLNNYLYLMGYVQFINRLKSFFLQRNSENLRTSKITIFMKIKIFVFSCVTHYFNRIITFMYIACSDILIHITGVYQKVFFIKMSNLGFIHKKHYSVYSIGNDIKSWYLRGLGLDK